MDTGTVRSTQPELQRPAPLTASGAVGTPLSSARPGSRRVCVVGLGYIGLPTASLLGTRGHQVHGVDIDPRVVETINAGSIHIVEPDLDVMVHGAVQSGRLRASTEACEADVFILAVPTPITPEKAPDLAAVEAATRAIVPFVRKGNLVILESTSPVGTTDGVVGRILAATGLEVGEDVHLAYCPERVLPGRILVELVENDRIVGGVDQASTEAAVEFYETFVRGEVIGTDSRTAEMVKLTENSFRDVNIAFANELSVIAAEWGVSVWELLRLANRHPRVNIHQPGPGVGGHCIAVDPWFIVHGAPESARLIRAAREVNDAKPDWVVQRVVRRAAQVREPVIACLGLSFKANVDDLRQSPAVEIVQRLRALDVGELLICEPHIDAHPELPLTRLDEALSRANIVLVLVDHKQFARIPREVLHEKILIDTRGLYL
ncbi:MAG: UDP-N-acetyl-D-mannosamine dehydrogenase [Planctomycetes bacterium]|nr:UDP-N-acetyl-D-mannosamine dehydrogenase [Planctomycetota bacterium]